MSWATLRRTGTAELLALLAAAGACSREAAATATPVATAAPTSAAPPFIRREIRVRVACDEEFRADKNWERRARTWVGAASVWYELRVGIRWAVVDVVPWTSDDRAGSLKDLLDQMEADVSRDGADVVVGFTGQTRAKGADRDYRSVGRARFFGPVAIVGRTPSATEEDSIATLVHEWGHVLGAWHSDDRASVMHPGKLGADFDKQAVAAIEIARDLDFGSGAAWFGDSDRRRIRTIYGAGHAASAELPYVSVALADAWDLAFRDGDVAGGRAACRHALDEQESCTGPSDRSIVGCLTQLARTDLLDPGRDLDEAERLALRAHDVVAATKIPEDPPLDSELVLADVAWECGRRHEAITRYRKVYDARRSALGNADPDTAAVRSALEQRVRAEAPPRDPTQRTDAASTDVAALPANPSLAFLAPFSDTIHVHRVPSTKNWMSGAPPSDFGRDAFDVAVAASGTLAMELIETGGAPGALPEVCCRVAEHVPATVNARTASSVGFGFWTIDPKVPADGAAYRFALVVRPRENRRGSTIESVDCEAPWSARSSVDRTFDAGDAAFVRFPVGAVQLFRREWLGVPPGPPVALGDVRPKRTWRLELTFTPDPPK